MKALVAHGYGDIADLRIENVPEPVAGPGEIVVQIAATSLNPVDLKSLRGELRALFETSFPFVPGTDSAGTVVGVGPGVTDYVVGDRVGGAFHAGLAERAVAHVGSPLVAKIPSGIDFETAAAAPVVGLAAMDALAIAGDVRGRTVGIIGASGSVGMLCVQLAAAGGAHVIATARGDDADWVRSLGAHEVIDFAGKDAVAGIARVTGGGADVVIDLVHAGPALLEDAPAIAAGGLLVSTLFGPGAEAFPRGIRVGFVRMDEGGAVAVPELYERIASGALRVTIGRRFAFDDVIEALRALDGGHVRGKIVVQM